LVCVTRMRETLLQRSESEDWRGIFHTYEELKNAPPLRFAIDGFLQEAGITLIGGLAGHGKTLVMLEMARALLEEKPLFGHEPFAIPGPAKRILYLIPEAAAGPFWSRIQLFRLQQQVINDRLLVRTLSLPGSISLSDQRLLKAAEGADVFLDTAVRFMDGSENDVENARDFANSLFALLSAGARTITGAHHAPKSFGQHDHMTLENVLRGSGDLGAAVCTAWGLRQIDTATNRIFIQNVKSRDFQAPEPFLVEARPHLEANGRFQMIAAPGAARDMRSYLKSPDSPAPHKLELNRQAHAMKEQGLTTRQIGERLGIGKSTVSRIIRDPVSPLSQIGTASGQNGNQVGENSRLNCFSPVPAVSECPTIS
jgi:hypothetical protein